MSGPRPEPEAAPAPDAAAAPSGTPVRSDRIERAAVLEAAVADGILLVDTVRVRAHGLNASAAAVWRAGASATTVGEVIDLVAAPIEAGTDPRRAGAIEDDVRRAIVALAGEGLLHLGSTSPSGPAPSPPPDAATPATGSTTAIEAVDEHPRVDDGATIGPFRATDRAFDLTTADDAIRAALAEIWTPLAIAGDRPTGPIHHYRIAGPPDDLGSGTGGASPRLLVLDGRVVARVTSDAALVAHAVWQANQLASAAGGAERFLRFHAAAVELGGGAVLLPAEMNSGKSTLATALVEAGAGYLTDETSAVDLESSAVLPYPKAITLDPGSWPRFERLAPPFLDAQPDLAHDKWYVDPEAVRAGSAVTPVAASDGQVAAHLPIAAIVFPSYRPEDPTSIVREPPVTAAAALAHHSFNLVATGQAGVDLIAHLATTVPCWSLSASDVDTAVAAILDATHHPAPPPNA
jgi:hypothetical protein